MPPKPVTRAEHEALCSDVTEAKDEIKEVKALTFELRDNHLKHLQIDVSYIKGQIDSYKPLILALMTVTVIAIIGAIVDRFFL